MHLYCFMKKLDFRMFALSVSCTLLSTISIRLSPVYADDYAESLTPYSPTQPLTSGRSSTLNDQPAISLPVDSRYVLGAGDRLRLEVFTAPEYTRESNVLTDGTINLPLIGVIPVAGMTLEQASATITSKLSLYIRDPTVNLDLLATRPLRVAIAGEVNRPGSYTIAAQEDNSGLPTVTRLVQLAGGITQSADIRSIQVRRLQGENQNEPIVFEVNLWDLVRSGDLRQDVLLRDQDMIFIPTASTFDASEATTLAAASFSPATITINVVGEVANPGAIQVPPNTPLTQAILAAGGFTNRAAEQSVDMLRLNPNGTIAQRRIEINFSQGVSEESNPALRNNDTIVVRRSNTTAVLDTVGSFFPPVNALLNILRIFRSQ